MDNMKSFAKYGKHLLHLCESHDLLIVNGLLCFLNCCGRACFSHGGGASVDDSVANTHLIHIPKSFRSLSNLPFLTTQHWLFSMISRIHCHLPRFLRSLQSTTIKCMSILYTLQLCYSLFPTYVRVSTSFPHHNSCQIWVFQCSITIRTKGVSIAH